MKRLYIIVEGPTEQEFVRTLIAPYLREYGIFEVTPILIRTSKTGRGGFSNYQYLKNDVERLLKSEKTDFVVSMFVDFFRCPEVPNKERWSVKNSHVEQVEEMEQCIKDDIEDARFIPYIQLHEFEALLFASNKGFYSFFDEKQKEKTQQIINSYENPEDINTAPNGAPSKRILAIKEDYDKVLEGNLIALEIGFAKIIEKCPRFRAWIEKLIESCKE
ncbi:DUF4276 family protein [Bacteroides sp. UBA939]|uniref:DUF4276 family protein n=1 Tax=Bacteroides sp. UBA939 TaxID=1946092 RepID=UPI0025BC882E|nr:DUF4276 family protein [Bacteroides sp. UBA939]